MLDAPALRDDYYCTLLAYSETAECLAVGLASHVYLWSERRGVNTPDSLTTPFAGHVTSLSFSSTEGGHAILAIGRADGRITLWSPFDADPRFDTHQPSAVCCVCFSSRPVKRTSARDPHCKVSVDILLVGDEVGHVYVYAIEWPNETDRDLFDWHGAMTLVVRLTAHTQQVCGLSWSPDNVFFASGGNDNNVFLFETRKVLRSAHSNIHLPEESGIADVHPVRVRHATAIMPVNHSHPVIMGSEPTQQENVVSLSATAARHVFRLNAACKALSFSATTPSLLALGGGSNDRAIHFFHTYTGSRLATIDCHAQVTSLV